ncbi:MAG: hypothetical protein L6Q57_07030 [Alphaproteobacteria bacterium]|nr:hypothetical protein [Alphaproteobacteria bacterium]
MAEKTKKPRFIKPPNVLKQKVGTGGIDEKTLDKSQHYMDTVDLDFTPYAHQFLETMKVQIDRATQNADNFDAMRELLAAPVMQLKANGGMFAYPLVSNVADIALQFLDNIVDINEDAVDVLRAHYNTIQIIMNNKLKGTGGKEGDALVSELQKACKRYFSKHKHRV